MNDKKPLNETCPYCDKEFKCIRAEEKPHEKLSYDALRELWRQAVDSKAHQLLHDAQDLHEAFGCLTPGDALCLDAFCLFERQIALVRSELKRLVGYSSKLYGIWPPKKKKKDESKES